MKKILVLGSSGFIGKEIVKKLKRQFDLECPGREKLDLNIVNLSYFKDKELFDVIVFAAGVPRGKIEKGEKNELMFIENLLKSMKDRSSHFIYLSSLEIFGKEENIEPRVEPNPINEYAINKLKEEELISREYTDHTILRLPGVFGQNQDHGFIKTLMDSAKTGKQIVLNGNGENVRGFIWVEDIAEIVKKTIMDKVFGKINLISNELLSLNQYVDKLEKVKKLKINTSFCEFHKSNVFVKTDFEFNYSTFEQAIAKINI